jgi:hypothetical protein
LSHSLAMCARLGLTADHPRTLWYCGDYAFYCAHHNIPEYDYYLMIEFDVAFTRPNSLLRHPAWVWHGGAQVHFPTVYGVLFPFVVLSQRALLHLLDWRRREASRGGDLVFCEAFVPSALKEAGMNCVDLNVLFPGAWAAPTFRVGAPMLMGNLPELASNTEILHPVFAEREYLARLIAEARHVGGLDAFVTMLDDPARHTLTSDLRRRFLAEATETLTGAAHGTD